MTPRASTDTSATEVRKLLEMVAETLDIEATKVGMDTDLPATGRLDSLAIVSLVAFLENEIGLKLPVDEIVPENFVSVRRIVDLVERSRR